MTCRNWPRRPRLGTKNARRAQGRPRRRGGGRAGLGLGSVTLAAGLLAVATDGAPAAGHPTGLVAGHAGLAGVPGILDRASPHGADGGNPANLVPPSLPSGEAPIPRASGPSIPSIDLVPWAGIPATVLAAYQQAAAAMAVSDPGCHLPVALLAAIGEVESGQAGGGMVNSAGTTFQPILGPALDGTNGDAAIRNTYGTQWGQNGPWARAVGPMQFIPSTWAAWGAGGNPDNVDDAALAAARYLCAGGQNLATPAGLNSAIESYNPSYQYLVTVLEWMGIYSGRMIPVPDAAFMTVATDAGSSPAMASPRKTRTSQAGTSAGNTARRPAPRPAASGGLSPAPSTILAISGSGHLPSLSRTLKGVTTTLQSTITTLQGTIKTVSSLLSLRP
jgi:hypothetical protein